MANTNRPLVHNYKDIFRGRAAAEAYMKLNEGLNGVLQSPEAQYQQNRQKFEQKQRSELKNIPDIPFERKKKPGYEFGV